MPIKFRCRFCQQFLGISRSRAGAIVDCPQCGRSIRVPELDGRTRRLPAQPVPGRDESLISALSELSSLTEHPTGQIQPEPLPAEEVPVTAVEPALHANALAAHDTAAAATSPEVEIISREQDWEHGEMPAATTSQLPTADELSKSLSEIAAFETSAPSVSDELLRDMRHSRRDDAWRSVTTVLFLLLGLAGGTAGGWWLTRTGFLPTAIAEADDAQQPADDDDRSKDIDPNLPSREELTHTAASQPREATDDYAGRVIRGRIEYVSEAGHLLPDEGALVLLLPQARQGTSLLDGGNLRLSTDAPDFRATVAAMNVLGAAATKTDENGNYTLHHERSGDASVIVVSQHLPRAVDSPVPADIQNTLLNWFESPTHVTGKLMVGSEVAPESGVLDFQLGVGP
ncbi:MAG: hypothetical protein NXI04_11275 [Planctomycetaceae bacterium]|nr:hypothetical protein [Planctomycetaceae bacterium]